MAAMFAFERQYEPEDEVVLGELTGDSYTSDVAKKYLDAASNTSEITLLMTGRSGGNDFTGVLPLTDSEGNSFAGPCVDVPVSEIGNAIFRATATDALKIVIIGFVAAILMGWVSCDVVEPINRLERSVLDFAGRSHGQRDIGLLRIEAPDIHTGNEVEAFSDAVVRMIEDMHSYVKDTSHVGREAERMKAQASAMKVQANKDPLTDVRNKTTYDAEVAVIEERIAIGDVDLGIIMIDLNYLKVLNDTYGHEKGDVTIKLLCHIICDTFAHSPVFRIGDDEFCGSSVGTTSRTSSTPRSTKATRRSSSVPMPPCTRTGAAVTPSAETSCSRCRDEVLPPCGHCSLRGAPALEVQRA